MNFKTCLSFIILLLIASPNYAQKKFTSISSDRYPKTVAFRSTEYALRRGVFIVDSAFNKVGDKKITPMEFAKDMYRFPVIMGKMVDEERTGGTQNVVRGYSYSKGVNPESKVILHFNGRNRRPEFLTEKKEPFFPGHWLYRVSNEIVQSGFISKEQNTFVLKDVSMYKSVNFKKNDIVFCLYSVHNTTKDFYHSEYVKLIGVDVKNNSIKVERGYFKSTPNEYKEGFGLAELAVFERKNENRLYYNFSTLSPKDKYGRTCNEALSDEIKSFKKGALNAIDGVIFDATTFTATLKYFDGNLDLDLDGIPEKFGFKNGVNQMIVGYDDFFKKLRYKMGNDFMLMADARTALHNRSFTYLNGTESEGWPQKLDEKYVLKWSTGLARHQFIDEHLFDNKVNKLHQFNVDVGAVNQSLTRLIQVAAASVNAAHTAKYVIAKNTGNIIGYTDEMSKGIENDFSGWLGKPLSEMKSLGCEGKPFKVFENLNFTKGDFLTETEMPASEVVLKDIPVEKKDLYVRFKIKGNALEKYPKNSPRVCWLEVVPEDGTSFQNPLSDKEMKSLSPYVQEFFFDEKAQEYGAYFRWISTGKINLKFTIEGVEPASIEWIKLYDNPEVIHREFENGIVIGNPSLETIQFDLEKWYPNKSFKKIRGFFNPQYNSGEKIAGKISIGSLAGIFLEKIRDFN